jgi:hypothetical protein
MSSINQDAVLAHLKSKWQGRPCPMCNAGNWELQDSVFELRQFNQGTLVVGGVIIPVVPVICKNCGNTVLVNAILSSAIDRPSPDKK